MPSLANPVSLDDFLSIFQSDFRRKERAIWAGVYVAGLLSPVGRKTIEGIARQATLPDGHPVEDARQALQNFLHESPWDEQRVLRRYRHWLSKQIAGAPTLVVEDISVVKQGNHSVGVHRQFSRELGRKVNCQVIPTLFVQAGEYLLPVAMRLYLPRSWQSDPARLDRSKVPTTVRQQTTKAQVALSLLDELLAERFRPSCIRAGQSYREAVEFTDGLHDRGLASDNADPTEDVVATVGPLKEQFGLDHFEGRSWRGLHHHLCLVMLAFGFRALAPDVSRF